ncbi:hypothetical protein A2732_02310 [Candidatus Nomurabacteria bacterium RIFCSPHIGHO2_01_FULL_40_10]|nr:MAG: hypothetical protein A2732_02310 [Candidatus Nomurabacteria bacterium RIFCSPHIGHO2_01_FULL_40_10]
MEINYLAVLVAAIASMVVGSVWYGPLFGKKFAQAMGMDKLSPEQQAEMKKGMTMTYLWQFVASLVMFYVLAWLMGALNQMSVVGGLTAAFWVWIGFVVPLKLSDAIWGGKMSLFWIDIGANLVTLLVAGAIIGAW